MIKRGIAFFLCSLSILFNLPSVADPYPPTWDAGAGVAIHYDPVSWPSEPVNPVNCGTSCGDWKPYTRFQQNMNDPRTQDPSNGGTSPQAYVNVTSSCSDKTLPSIYYYLHQGAAPADDVLMFRWRVESAPHNYATGPSAGNYGSSNPWSSALWTVLFDIDGSGYRSLAAHLDGSTGSPAAAIDRLVGIWSNTTSQSLDYINDGNVHALGHNPTAFIGPTGKVMNFHNTGTPNETWANGSAETVWDYGTTRALTVTQNSCTEYFIDYQIPIALLDASGINGPKVTRTSPISMLFCTANSLNNPFQKDCAVNKSWTADATKPAPYGDYISFNQTEPYSQPIISSVTATAPNSCPGSYTLKATVQDTLALQSGVVVPSVQSVDFFYWRDDDGDGLADDAGGAWTKITPTATLDTGTLNKWTASWDASALPKGKYLVGTQALDDNTKLDTGMTATGINNRTFSYLAGDATNKIYIGGAWQSGQLALFPTQSPTQTPSSSENWYGNPDVTGLLVAVVGTAINTCGVAPTIALTADTANVAAAGTVGYTITLTNPVTNSSSITISEVTQTLPAGFTYQTSTTLGTGGLGSTDPSIAGQVLTWTYGSPVSLAPGATATLVFDVTATSTAGNYNATAASTTSFGLIQSSPVAVAVDAARLSFTITPSAYSIAADGSTQLTFTLNYANDSTVSVTGANITGSLPSGSTYVTCTGGSACSNTSGSLSWTLGTLAGGATGSATLVLTVPNSWTTSSLTEAATLAATAPDASPVTKAATSTVAVTGYSAISAAAFTLTKSANATQIAPGATVIYTIAYANYGGTSAGSVVITDSLPAGMTYASSTGGGTNLSNVVTWNIGTVAAGASGSVTVTATAANPFTAYTNPSINAAAINWSGGSTVTSSNVAVGVTGQACSTYYFRATTGNVGFDTTQKLATTSPVPISSDVGSSVTVTAPAGGSGRTIWLEALRFYQDPATTSDVPFDGNITSSLYIDRDPGQGLNVRTTVYDYNSTTGVKTQLGQSITSFGGSSVGLATVTVTPSGTLAKNHRLLWVYEVQIDSNSSSDLIQLQYAGTVANALRNSGGTTFANSNAQYCITPPASLNTQVSVNQTSIAAAATPVLTYTINYSNTGTASATNSSLVATLPAGFTGCQYSLNNSLWSACSGAGLHTFSTDLGTLGTVAGGGAGIVYVRGTVPAGTTGGETFTKTVSLSSDQTTAVSANAVTLVATPGGGGAASLTQSLSASTTTAAPGDSVIYSVTVTNVGGSSASDVIVSNILPVQTYFTYGGVCSDSCTGTTTLTWPAIPLAAGASKTYTYTMTAGSTGLPSGVTLVDSTATVAATGGLTATSNTVTVTLNGNPELSAVMSATPNTGLVPGDTIVYSITLQNIGNASASDVVVSDPIPANTSFNDAITVSLGSGNFDAVNNRVVFDMATLAAGASVTLSYEVTVNGLPSGPTTIDNTASASASNAPQMSFSRSAAASATPILDLRQTTAGAGSYPAATLTANASSTTIYVDTTAALQINQYVQIGSTVGRILSLGAQSLTLDTSVTASTGASVIGAITLNLAYRNIGNATATSTSLTDTLPAGLGFYTSSPLATSAPSIGASGAVTWALGSLAVDAGGTVSIIAFPTNVTGNLTSQGVLSASNATSATADATIAIGGLTVSKTTSTPIIPASGSAIYTITLSNSLGSPLTNVSTTDTLPDGFSYDTSSATVGGTPTEPTFAGSDTGQQQPQWTGLTVPANSSLVITFQANAASTAGAGTYQNDVSVTAAAGVGILQFDALSNTAEDVTLLAASRGVLKGYVFYRNGGSGSNFIPGSDLPLADVRVEIYKLGADCSDPYSSSCYVVFTDSNGYFQKVVAAEGWYVKVVSNTGDLSSSWDQVVGNNATEVVVPDQDSVTDQNGFKLTTGYMVTASAGTGGSISPVSHTVPSGDTTAFTVTADTGYSIDPVTGTCGGNLSGATYTTNAITAACTVIANFSLTTYTVTFDLAGGSRTSGGVLSQSVAYGTGANAPLFTAPVGKTFTGWSTTFSSITGPLTVTALYTDTTYNVTPSAGSGGSISPATVQSVVHGNTTGFTLTPDTGYSIVSVGGTCGGNLSGASYTTNAVTAACTVVASFSMTNYTVTFDLDGGSRSGGGILIQSIAHGSDATAPTLTPPTGKVFASWSTSFTSVTGTLTVTALYVDATYSVTPSAGTGGSISPSGVQTVTHGNTTGFTVSADAGYSITPVTGTCGGNLVGTSYTTNAITASCTVLASFTANNYLVTFDLDGGTLASGTLSQSVAYNTAAIAPTVTPPIGKVFASWNTSFSAITGPLTVTAIYFDASYNVTPSAGIGGSISPDTAQTVTHGNTTGFTVSADTGYSITTVAGSCGGNLSGASYTTNAVTADCTVIASFSLVDYTVIFDLAGGTRTGGGILSQTITHGADATAPTLTPPAGKIFTGWSSSFIAITGPLTVTAIYGDFTHSVTPSAGVGGSISPATVQTIVDGSAANFTVSADTGYSIAAVAGTCGGNLSGASYTTNAVTADCTVIASFNLLDYTVIFDLAGGTRTGGGILSQIVTHGTDATAPTLTSPTGKTFTGWSSSFVAITGPLTLVAIYDNVMHSVTATAGTGGSISPATVQTIVDGSITSFTISANTGYNISAVSGTCGGNLSGATYTTNAVIADCTLSASFTAVDYPVTFDLAGGSRTGGGVLSQSVAYDAGATAPLFTAPVGKTFTGWSTTFSSITGPLTVTALYTDTTYNVTPSAGSGGNISPATVQTVADGATTSFTVTPNTGFSIASVAGTCGGSLSGNTYLTDAVAASCSVIATFTSSSYTVTFDLAGGSRSGGGTLSQSVAHGAAAIAPDLTPPAGKIFTAWSTGFSSITGSLTVTALYADTTYTVTANATTGGSITPAVAQTVAYNATASYQVLPASGYTLTGVSGICSGIHLQDIYTTSAITADCVLNFTFHKTLKSVDEGGAAYVGEVLTRTSGTTFLVEGGSGSLIVAASVKQVGITTAMTTGTASDFLAGFGASLVDNGNGSFSFTANRSGLYIVTFTDMDGQSLTMTFTVYPTIGFTSTYQESAAGKTTQVRVLLDDDPIDYPVEAPFFVDGNVLATDLSAQGIFTITSGRVASIQFVPNASSGDIDFVLPATGLQNAVLGSIVQHTVSLKDLASVPLNLSLSAQQAGETKQLMLNADGTATLFTSLTGTGYSYDWSGSAPELGIGSATGAQPTFNPQTLNGSYLVKVTVTELAAPNRSITVELLLRIVADAPASYTNFYNLEYQISPHRLPICTDGGMERVDACHDVLNAVYMETLSTYEIKLGRSSDYASWRDLEFALSTEANDIRDEKGQPAPNQKDLQYLHLGYEVDFEISGLEQSGQTVPVVIPLKPGMTIPARAVWRKYSLSGWHNFVEDEVNRLFSAKRDASGACPSPSDTGWNSGLNAGDDCVRLIIQDGGPNDFDGRADGVIRDPSVLAVKAEVIEVTTVGKGKSRGGAIDVLLLLMLVCMSITLSARKIALIKNKSSHNLPFNQDNQ